MILTDEDLTFVTGGAAISGTLINAVIKAVTLVLDIGRAVGSAIRRGTTGYGKC